MKRIIFCTIILLIVKVCAAQSGSQKICPNTPFWNSNKQLMQNEREMYNEYAKGPDGCWWLKLAKFPSYKEGFYQFNLNGSQRYYYNSKKKVWETSDRKSCLATPPFGK